MIKIVYFFFRNDYLDMSNLSLVRVYYPLSSSLRYKTNVLLTWYEIIGNFGGVLGLCIGFSAIGAMEIIYFLSIKFYQNFQLTTNPNLAANNTNKCHKKQNLSKKLTYQQVEMIMVEEYMKNKDKKMFN